MADVDQETKLIRMLRKAGRHGVENYKFPQNRILCYTKVISRLRADGYNIYKERVVLPNGRSTGVYKYYLQEQDRTPWWKLNREK